MLEQRYYAMKISDVDAALSPEEKSSLALIREKVNAAREARGVGPLQGMVIEADWPEYLPARAALEQRIRQEQCEHEWEWWQVAGEGKVCRKCGMRDYYVED